LLAAVAVAGLFLPRVLQTEWLRFSDPFGDHPPYSRVLFHVTPGNQQVVYGTGIDIHVTTEGPAVDRLQLVWKPDEAADEEVLPLFAEPGGVWKATIASVTTPGQYHIRAHAGRSQRFRVSVLTVPRLEGLRFRITPPAYTNRHPYDGPLPQGGIAGLPGTRVQIWAKSNRPLSGGTLTISTADHAAPLALTPTSPDSPEATATFDIQKPGKLRLRLKDTDGQESNDVFTAPIAVLSDERPSIRLVEPPPISLATPVASVPVVLAAEDDYGITRIELFRSLNDSRPLPMNVAVPLPPPTRWNGTVVLPLADFGLEPGDEIKLFARVEDNDPAGPKGAESRIVTVRIIAQADFERMVRARQSLQMLQSKYQQAQRRLDAVADEADRLKKKVKKDANAEEMKQARQELSDLAKRMHEESEALQRLSRQKLGYDLDKELTEHLEKLSRRLEEAAKEAERLASDKTLTPEQLAEALQKLQERLQREQQQLQQEASEPVEQLAKVQPLIEDAFRFVILTERQRSLAERLKSVKDQDRVTDAKEKNRLRDLQAEQEQIRKDLNKLLDDLEEHVEKLPEDKDLDELRKQVNDFVEAVRKNQIPETMTEAEGALSGAQGKRGHTAADKAADLMEKLCQQCQGDQGMMGTGKKCLKFKPPLRDGLGQTVEQLLRDAGLMPGRGQGGAPGSSAQRNTLENVGLYGGLPGLEELTPKPSTRPGGQHGIGQSSTADGGNDRGQRGSGSGATSPRGSGSTEMTVPPTYRRRVAEYFQRVADETGNK
jgi:hypothetical protein